MRRARDDVAQAMLDREAVGREKGCTMTRQELNEQARLLVARLERGGDVAPFLRVFPKRTQKAIGRQAGRILEEKQAVN